MQVPESAHLVRNGLEIVLLEVQDPQFAELANTFRKIVLVRIQLVSTCT